MKLKSKQLKLLAMIAAVVVFVGAVIAIVMAVSDEPEITNELVASKLETVSELTTAKLTYNGLLHYEEGAIPLLTQKAFFMIYCAEVEAGIDLSQVDVAVTKNEVRIVIPETEILDIYVDPDSVEFYDERVALFNPDNKDDAIDAIAAAEADVVEKAGVEQLVETSKQQTTLLLESLFKDTIGDRTLVVRYE